MSHTLTHAAPSPAQPRTAAQPVPVATTGGFEDVVRALRYDPVTLISNLAADYGDIVHLPFGTNRLYLINRPEWISELFLGQRFTKWTKEVANPDADLQAPEPKPPPIAMLRPMFTREVTPSYAPLITRAAERAHARWEGLADPRNVDIHQEMMRITLETVGQTLFQTDLTADGPGMADALADMEAGYGFNPVLAILGELLPEGKPPGPRTGAAREHLLGIMRRLTAAHRASPADYPNSLLTLLIRLKDDGQLPDDEVVANYALGTFLAMHEVTVTTMAWAWYLLGTNPDVEAKVQAELAAVLGGRTPTYDDVARLPYLESVLKETRRLYPTVWLVGRFARVDVPYGGYEVPAGSFVLASQWVMHHDARFFPDPERFDPDRWTPEAEAALPAYAYFPFSIGYHACAGEDFAKMEDALVMATLLQRWQARVAPGFPMATLPFNRILPRYGLLRMTLDRRTA